MQPAVPAAEMLPAEMPVRVTAERMPTEAAQMLAPAEMRMRAVMFPGAGIPAPAGMPGARTLRAAILPGQSVIPPEVILPAREHDKLIAMQGKKRGESPASFPVPHALVMAHSSRRAHSGGRGKGFHGPGPTWRPESHGVPTLVGAGTTSLGHSPEQA